jgi:glutathione S-transferase
MKLYWGPHTCAIGIHVLLEEIGRPYETEQLDVSGGATHRPPFSGLNPKGKVPTLVRDDGSVLTEFSAIAIWLARTHPEKSLLPNDPDTEARIAETMSYVEGMIHGQGYARLFKPEKFEPQDIVHGTLGLGQSAVKHQGREIVETGSRSSIPNSAATPMRSATVLRLQTRRCCTSSAGRSRRGSPCLLTSPHISNGC